MKKPLIFFIVSAILVVIFFYFSQQYKDLFELATIKSFQAKWIVYYEENPFLTLASFFAINSLMAALPIAGITLISLLGGALFGFGTGVVISSTATACGNLIGFFIARYFLQDYVKEKYHQQYENISHKYEKYGAYVLFSLRVFPLIPSFIATVVMSLTNMKWMTFFLVSWIGRLPMVLVYSYAGYELSRINSLNEILSPTIILSLMAMGLMPWLFRFFIMRK